MGKLKKESVMQRQEMNGARVPRFCSILALTMPAVLGLAVSPSAATEKEVGRLLKRGGRCARAIGAAWPSAGDR
jgi:hypothetical protein